MTANASARLMPPQRRKGLNRAQRRTATFYLFISPWLITFVLLGIIPLIIGLSTSFTNYDGMNFASMKFVGLRNYLRAFSDKDVPFSLVRTIYWGLLNLPIWMGFSFLIALILNQKVRGRDFFRVVYYLPSVIPVVAAITAWRIILDRNFGLLNELISQFRPGTAIGWMSDYALLGMGAIAIWGGLGGGMIIFLAGLQDIPDELVEAARIDGANTWHIFRHITWPLMTPVIFFQLIMGLIGSFQQLSLPLIVSQIGAGTTTVPPRDIYLYMIHVYRQIFSSQRYGYGTALLWMLFIGVILLTAIIFWSSKFWVYAGDSKEGEKK
jgi:multiple sugar transport system permease protein